MTMGCMVITPVDVPGVECPLLVPSGEAMKTDGRI